MIDSVPCRIYRIIKAKSSSVRFTVLHSKFLFPQNSFPINLYKSYVKRITCKAVIIPPSLPHLVLILRPQSSKSRGKILDGIKSSISFLFSIFSFSISSASNSLHCMAYHCVHSIQIQHKSIRLPHLSLIT